MGTPTSTIYVAQDSHSPWHLDTVRDTKYKIMKHTSITQKTNLQYICIYSHI